GSTRRTRVHYPAETQRLGNEVAPHPQRHDRHEQQQRQGRQEVEQAPPHRRPSYPSAAFTIATKRRGGATLPRRDRLLLSRLSRRVNSTRATRFESPEIPAPHRPPVYHLAEAEVSMSLKPRVVVAGGTGFLGKGLVPAL